MLAPALALVLALAAPCAAWAAEQQAGEAGALPEAASATPADQQAAGGQAAPGAEARPAPEAPEAPAPAQPGATSADAPQAAGSPAADQAQPAPEAPAACFRQELCEHIDVIDLSTSMSGLRPCRAATPKRHRHIA